MEQYEIDLQILEQKHRGEMQSLLSIESKIKQCSSFAESIIEYETPISSADLVQNFLNAKEIFYKYNKNMEELLKLKEVKIFQDMNEFKGTTLLTIEQILKMKEWLG